MAALFPVPFAVLLERMLGEPAERQAIFGLRRWNFAAAVPGLDLAVDVQGKRAATPFAVAAGPHTQTAVGILLSWLAGARVIELKTVQVDDRLESAKPCIDTAAGGLGLDVEWSQELTLDETLDEYVAAAMLIEVAKAEGLAPGLAATVFDVGVGYDLAGIRSAAVGRFLSGMIDATAVVERLRAEIPTAHARLRDLAFPTRIASTATLSTFHGCPVPEIEAIGEHLMGEVGLDLTIKLDPTLLGPAAVDEILHDRLGFTDLSVPAAAFAGEAGWDEITAIVERLDRRAAALGRHFAVKFSNTLVVENRGEVFPTGTPVAYLSGRPLYVPAIELVRRFRDRFGDRIPISFSAGIDAENFAETVALGLRPVAVCTDLLTGEGYGKGHGLIDALAEAMRAVAATDVDLFTLRAFGSAEAALDDLGLPAETSAACRAALVAGDPRAAAGADFDRWVSAARLRNTRIHAAKTLADPRYRREATVTPVAGSGAVLGRFDCETCGHCISVCPNAAVFGFDLGPLTIPLGRLLSGRYALHVEKTGDLVVGGRRQIGVFADLCNACGACVGACPEEGAPHAVKPVFFGRRASFEALADRDGILIEPIAEGRRILHRQQGDVVEIEARDDGSLRYRGDGFDLTFTAIDRPMDATGSVDEEVDLGRLRIVLALVAAVTAPNATNWVTAMLARR
jgi:putative selenate reductase